ncbi:MAG: RDD family protein [Proteobacteria bacterium]|nr:RDD family protein [Pseudomonadota bacterium]
MNPFTQLATVSNLLKVPPRRTLASALGDDFSLYGPAGFILRWYALTIDLVMFAPIHMLIRVSMSQYLERLVAHGQSGRAFAWSFFAFLIPVLVYFVIPTWRSGQTLGKRIVGIRVITAARQPALTLADTLRREVLGKAASIALCGAGFLLMRGSPRKRALHDYLGKTMVISYAAGPSPAK